MRENRYNYQNNGSNHHNADPNDHNNNGNGLRVPRDEDTVSARYSNQIIEDYSRSDINTNFTPNNVSNTNGYATRNISDATDFSYSPSELTLNPVEPLRYLEQVNEEQSQPITDRRPVPPIEDQYHNFIANPTTNNINVNIPAPQTAYNDVFITSNNHIDESNMFHHQQLPEINVIQTPSDFIRHESSQQFNLASNPSMQFNQNTEYTGTNNALPNDIHGSNNAQNYFNENDYYYNVSHNNSENDLNHGHNNLNANMYNSKSHSPTVLTSNSGSQVILNNQYDHAANNDPYYNNYANASDIEMNYVDQNGDDYQIRSYLGNDGEIVDPYTNKMPIIYDDDKLHVEKDRGLLDTLDEDLSNANLITQFDNTDANTLNKLENAVASRSVLSSNSSANSERPLVLSDNSTARNRLNRSNTEIRKFKLWRGNFVFDSPISASLLDKYRLVLKDNTLYNEFKFMRYQAITCEPNELALKNFTVRQLQYLNPRQTELMIVITMYNEDHILLGRTLKGVMDNIKHMVKKRSSSIWGPDAWKKIVVCVVSDGRSKINEKALALMSTLGCYQDGFAKDEINDQKVKMHAYEHTTMMNITEVTEDTIQLKCDNTTVPVQLLFALKEQNQKKINSHRWAFEGFAELLQPNVVVLLDAGTMPGKDSIYELWREFRNPNVGGACGEIKTDLGKGFGNLINPLVASQNFEYKMSNILDKTTESNFGYITVLPGAFSAYRFVAVQGQPLDKYFYGEQLEDGGFNFFSSNMYLAEDRILCFEIVTKKDSCWTLKYCRSSYASTDVPERVPEFILQRRRWLNGSFFAAVYSFCHFNRIWTSGHNIGRKFLLTIEFVYLFFNTLISWFSLSSFFLVFRILSLSIAQDYSNAFNVLSVVFLWLYGVSVFSTFVLSLGNKPKSTEKFYVVNFVFFAILMAYMVFCSIFMSVKSFEDILDEDHITFAGLITTKAFRDLVISMGSTYVLYIISSIIYLQPWHMITSFIQYILLSPSYINILNIYAFCNVHDLSWGTKGASAGTPLGKIHAQEDGTFKMEIMVSEQEIQANYNKFSEILHARNDESETSNMSFDEQKTGYYANIRSLVIIFWVLTNFGVVAAVLETGGIGDYISLRKFHKTNPTMAADTTVITTPMLTERSTIYFSVILWLVALSAVIRFFGCSIYMLNRFFNRVFNK